MNEIKCKVTPMMNISDNVKHWIEKKRTLTIMIHTLHIILILHCVE